MGVRVVPSAMDDPDVIGVGQAIFLQKGPQRLPANGPAPAQLIAPVAPGIASQGLLLKATNRGLPADADALRAVEHVFASLRVEQRVEAERLTPQPERLQSAECQAVFVVTGFRLAVSRITAVLGIERAGAVLPAEIKVDEGRADAAAMIQPSCTSDRR